MTNLTVSVRISPETKAWLDKEGRKGETYDKIINRFLKGEWEDEILWISTSTLEEMCEEAIDYRRVTPADIEELKDIARAAVENAIIEHLKSKGY